MERSAENGASVADYYESTDVTEKYLSTADGGFIELEREAVDRYFPDSGAHVLDLGCGTGRTTAELVELGYETVGVDLTASFVEQARTFVPEADFCIGDARSLPFPDGTFRAVLFSYNGIDDITPEADRYRALREVHRVLQPGGVFAFSTRNPWSTYVVRSLNLANLSQYVEFWLRNFRHGRIFSRCKLDTTATGDPTVRYYIRPQDQKQQLRNCGFDVIDVLRTDGVLEPYFHHPYYVAQKPD